MKIFIPSRGRADLLSRGTLALFPESMHLRIAVVVHPSEFEEYAAKIQSVEVIAVDYETIAEKRWRIGRLAEDAGIDKFVMLDDDIDFLIRRGPDDWRLRACEPEEVEQLFALISELLLTYAQVAVSGREGNNRYGEGTPEALVFENTRAMRITAYRTREFLSVEHCRVPVMEDMDVTLQLLRKGHKNAVIAYWANGQRMTNAPGGCSIWRTLEIHNAAAARLAELHPDLVRVRQKTNKTDADGFGTRDEVTVQWKRAYRHDV